MAMKRLGGTEAHLAFRGSKAVKKFSDAAKTLGQDHLSLIQTFDRKIDRKTYGGAAYLLGPIVTACIAAFEHGKTNSHDIAEAFGIKPSAVRPALRRLVALGFIAQRSISSDNLKIYELKKYGERLIGEVLKPTNDEFFVKCEEWLCRNQT